MLKLPKDIQATLDRELCHRSFAKFAQKAWHVLEPTAELKWGWALDAICEHLQAVHDGLIRRLLINVPPGMMKSLLTSVMFPAWEWGAGGVPSMRFLSTSHKEALAMRDNIKCQITAQNDPRSIIFRESLHDDDNGAVFVVHAGRQGFGK